MRKFLILLGVLLAFFLNAPLDAYGKGFSGGGRSFSSGRSPSPSRSYTSGGGKSYSSGTSSGKSYTDPNSGKSYSSGDNKLTTGNVSIKPMAREDYAAQQQKYVESKVKYDSAKFKFNDVKSAESDFRAKMGSRVATKADSSYIPSTYKDPKNGNTYNVIYNSSGQAGYMGSSGWIPFTLGMLTGNALSNSMHSHGYGVAPTTCPSQDGENGLSWFVIIILIMIAVPVIITIVAGIAGGGF